MSPAAFAPAAAPDRSRSDPLVSARADFFGGAESAAEERGARHRGPDGELARLLDAEYGLRPAPVATGDTPAIGREDTAVAALRRACRLAVPLTPEAVLAHAHGGPRLTAVLTELWPDTVRGHGPRHAEAVLRTTLLASPGAPSTAFLLDLAASAGVHPLTAVEAADLAATADLRAVRHSAWRYLHLVPGGRGHLPDAATGADAYERLLLAPPAPGITWDPARPGRW